MSVRIEYRVGVQATADALWDAVADLPSWPSWNPMYERAAGRIAFHETLELVELMPGAEPRKLTPRVTTWTPREQLVWLERRGFMSRSLRYFEIEELAPGGGCIFANGEMFLGPLGERRGKKMAGKLRAQFEAIGERLKAKVEAG
jgi:hypothetical protein